VLYCNRCGTANRVLSRFCRQCGTSRPDVRWSCRGGEAESALLAILTSENSPRLRWEARVDEPVGTSPLVCSGLLMAVAANGRLTVFRERSNQPVHRGSLVLDHLVASPALVDGLLVAAADHRLQIVDLATMLNITPDTPSRDRMLEFPGTITSHLVTDGRARVVFTSVDSGRLYLHCLMTRPGEGLQLRFSRLLGNGVPADAFCPVAFLDDAMIVGEPEGHLWVYHGEGRLLTEDTLRGGVAPLPWLTRQGGVLAAGADGRIYRLDASLGRLCVADACERPLYAFGASDAHLVACHGRLVRHIRLASTVSTQFELPQACSLDPLVVANTAALLSDEGSVYLLELGGASSFVRWTQRLFSSPGAVQAPLVATPRTLFACGPAGEVSAVGWAG
jgi:hypothetical protein